MYYNTIMKRNSQKTIVLKEHFLKEPFELISLSSMFFYQFNDAFVGNNERHKQWEFAFVNSGQQIMTEDKKEFRLSKGQAFLHKPFSYHGGSTLEGKSSVGIFSFLCESEEINVLYDKVLNLSSYQQTLLKEIFDLGKKHLEPDGQSFWFSTSVPQKEKTTIYAVEQILKNKIELLFIDLINSILTKDKTAVSAISPINSEETSLINSIIEVLKEHIYDNYSLQEIANQLSYNPSYLCRAFKAHTGLTILDYYYKLKIGEAQKMIMEQKLPLKTISDNLNFDTIQYFNRIFKKYTGVTPAQFRTSIITSSLIYDTMFTI